MTPRRSSALLMALLLVGCSDDGPGTADTQGTPDTIVADTASGDGGVDASDGGGDALPATPGCSKTCGADEVCFQGACASAGPQLACGSDTFASGLPSSGTILYVDASASAPGDGTRTLPYRTIAAALAAIPDGQHATVAIAAGTYDEELTIGQRASGAFSADLYCRCPDMVRITRPLTVRPHVTATELTVRVHGCTIAPSGFDADTASAWPSCNGGSGDTVGLHAAGGKLAALNVLVEESVVAGWCAGVQFSAEPDPLLASSLCIAHSRVAGNVTGLDARTAPQAKIGAGPFAACSTLVESIGVTRSRVDHNRDYGVYLRTSARGIALDANVIERSGQLGSTSGGEGFGVYLGDIDSATLTTNIVRDNDNRGIALRNETAKVSTGVTIENNRILANAGAGIALQKLSATFYVRARGNHVSGTRARGSEPGGDGIQVSLDEGSPYNVEVSGNLVDGSARVGIFYDGVGGSVTNNVVSKSASYGLYLQRTSSVNVGGNSWRDNGAGTRFTSATLQLKYGALPTPPP